MENILVATNGMCASVLAQYIVVGAVIFSLTIGAIVLPMILGLFLAEKILGDSCIAITMVTGVLFAVCMWAILVFLPLLCFGNIHWC